jgi:predicted small lipoprotein YifL
VRAMRVLVCAFFLFLPLLAAGCGKKGPPVVPKKTETVVQEKTAAVAVPCLRNV